MMAEMLVVGGIVSVLIAIVLMTQLVTIKMQQQSLNNIHAQQYAWERAQEVRQQRGQAILESYTREAEKRLIAQGQQISRQWQTWAMEDAARVQDLTHQYRFAVERACIAYELERIPRIEDAPLPGANEMSWRPINLPEADLSRYDLSYRYLRQANLRNIRLANANLYMADLSGACLAGADLTGADLSAANLSGADLRGANLTGANFLVADMQQAMLADALLLAARNLTADQIGSAIIDKNTQLDLEVDITRPRIPRALSVGKASVNQPHEATDATTQEQIAPQGSWQAVNIETPLPTQPPVETPLPTEPSTPLPGMITEISPVCQSVLETTPANSLSAEADDTRPEQKEVCLSVYPSGHSHGRANKAFSRKKYHDKKQAKAR